MDITISYFLLNFWLCFLFFGFLLWFLLYFLGNFWFLWLLFISIDFFHQLSLLFPLSLLIFIHFISFFSLFFLIIIMLWFSCTEIAIKLIFAGAIFNIVFLVLVIWTIDIPKYSFVLCPKGILFFLLLSSHKSIHLGPPPLPEGHILNSKVFWFHRRNTATRFLFRIIVTALLFITLVIWITVALVPLLRVFEFLLLDIILGRLCIFFFIDLSTPLRLFSYRLALGTNWLSYSFRWCVCSLFCHALNDWL